jgi:hypothetical protein
MLGGFAHARPSKRETAVSNDFETSPEPDDYKPERPDPEEPETWLDEESRDAETHELDWADQHSTVEVPLSEEESPGPDVETASGGHVRPD